MGTFCCVYIAVYILTAIAAIAHAQEVPVATGRELQNAVRANERAIVITEHMDVRQIAAPVALIKEDISIRGECGSALPTWIPENLDPALLPLKPGQCLIFTDEELFEVRSTTAARVTIDNLYIRMEQFAISKYQVKVTAFSGTSVWISNTTMQGDRGTHVALSPFLNAALHVTDSTLTNFNHTLSPLLAIEQNSSAVFERCTISDITNPEVNGSAVWAGEVEVRKSSSVLLRGCTLTNVTQPFFAFSATSAGVFYSDMPLQVYDDNNEETYPARDASDADSNTGTPFLKAEDRPELPPVLPPALPPADAPGLAPLPVEDPDSTPDDPAPEPEPPEGGGDDGDGDDGRGDIDTAAVAGGAAAAVAIGLAIVGFIVYRMRKEHDKPTDEEFGPGKELPPIIDEHVDPSSMGGGESGIPAESNLPFEHAPPNVPPHTAGAPFFGAYGVHGYAPHPQDPYAYAHAYGQPGWGPPPAAPSWHGAQPAAPGFPPPGMPGQPGFPSMHRFGSAHSWASGRSSGYNPHELRAMPTTTFTHGSNWSDYQKAAHESESPLDALEVALDAMCSMKEPFYHRYMLLSSVERRVGGQGLVQFASIVNTQDKAAIKFYMDMLAFQRERDLYQDAQLKSMMPATLAIEENTSGECQTPYGYKFPPFVIIECGQSLDEWARDNTNSDFITIFQALSHSVRALRKLHSTGYAHRDIKPGNILRRPKQHDWTLIDFGCAAQIGSTAGLAFSLKYAPPEVMAAVESGCRTIHVDAAVDIWAIGVIAYELLTGERAFPADGLTAAEAEKKAQDAIAGRTQLPWEALSDGAKERLGKMRGLKRTVLRCLERDPAKRPSAEALLKSWDHTFDDMQTRGTDWSMGSAETNQSSMPP
eukprot:jgi/Ulvmu1/10455/UM063_0010.1